MARFAAIDVGSNAMRLRIVEAERPKNDDAQLDLVAFTGWREIASQRAPVRLGSEVFLTGKLTHGSISAACGALKEFKAAMENARVDAYRAVATSAVREASNSVTMVERARREAQVELEVIEGVEEARLIELAVIRRLELGKKSALLVDVGGGSTELTMLEGTQHTYSVSLPIGTVRLLEAYKSPRLLSEAVDRALTEALPNVKVPFDMLIGTGGNIETLAEICPLSNGVRGVDVPAMRALYREMVKMPAAERQKKWSLRPDRADTIVPAAAIYYRVAQALGKKQVVAPGVGLKEGVIDELVLKHYELWDAEGEAASVMDACTRLGRRYQFDEAHAKTVMGFAAAIFDDTVPLHGLGPRDRLLLRAAALLHDIGDFVRYDAHHKHTYYLVLHSDIIGLSADERAIVANIARYHRKSLPDTAHSNFRELGALAKERVRSLASILRIADALDREHLGKVRVVRAAVDREKKRLVLTVTGDDGRELEEWTLRAKADLLRDVFDLDVALA